MACSEIARLFRAGAVQHDADGLEQNPRVLRKTPVVDVLKVQLHYLVEVGDVAAAGHLPEPRDARADGEAALVVAAILLELIHGGRTRADDGHISLEHVPKLGELVQGRLADELANLGNARIDRVGNVGVRANRPDW